MKYSDFLREYQKIESRATRAELERFYKKFAKRADQRLVELERLTQSENFKGAKHFAYERAMRDIKQWSGEGGRRFNTKAPANKRSIKAKIADIRTFLESKTSTKTDIIAYYQKRQETIKERYGIGGAWEDMAAYYQRGINKKFDARYGSRTALKAIGIIQKNAEKIKAARKKHESPDIYGDDFVINEKVKDMLSHYSKDLRAIGIDI